MLVATLAGFALAATDPPAICIAERLLVVIAVAIPAALVLARGLTGPVAAVGGKMPLRGSES